MSGSDDNPRYVTQAQCAKQVKAFSGELKTVKVALIGEDMCGGLVKDVSDLANNIGEIQKTLNQREKKQELSMKWKLGIYGSVISAVALVVVEIIRNVTQLLPG